MIYGYHCGASFEELHYNGDMDGRLFTRAFGLAAEFVGGFLCLGFFFSGLNTLVEPCLVRQ